MVKSNSFRKSSKKLRNSLVNTHTKIVPPVKSFVLKAGKEFASRSVSVFNNLNTIEMNHNAWVSENETHDSFDLNNNIPPSVTLPPPVTSDVFKKALAPVKRQRMWNYSRYETEMEDNPLVSENETHDSFDLNNNIPPSVTSNIFKNALAPVERKRTRNYFRHEMNYNALVSENENRDSFDLNNDVPPSVTLPPAVASDVFKKPCVPVRRKRTRNYICYEIRNMRKWIKYNLEDIAISSDSTNTAVALKFLGELRKKKEQCVNEASSADDKVVFRKPSKRSLNVNNSVDSASTSNNEVREQHLRSEKLPFKKLKTSSSNIKLLHLQDDFGDA